jgi:hypothetical protein
MGVLDYSSSELFLTCPNLLLPPSQTDFRIIQIETQKGRLSRILHKSRSHCLHPCSHLSWRVFVPLGISIRHRYAYYWSPRISHLHSDRMESCGTSDCTTSFISSSISAFTSMGVFPLRHLLLCKCIFSTYIFSSGTFAECWTVIERWSTSIATPPSDHDYDYGGFRSSTVSRVQIRLTIDSVITIPYYGSDMESTSSEPDFKPLSADTAVMPTSPVS